MTRRLGQRDVVVGEVRSMPDDTRVYCRSASDLMVGYWYADEPDSTRQHIIRRDVWCSWPVIEEDER